MKLSYILSCFLLLVVNAKAQWASTSFPALTAFPIYDIEAHGSNFYATTATDFTSGELKVYKSGIWETVTVENMVGVPNFIASNGSVLAVSTYDLFSGSYLYVSMDDGATFSLDTAGIAKFGSGVAQIIRMEFFGDDLLVGVNGAYYLKDYNAGNFVQFTTSTQLTGSTDQVVMYNDKMYAYDNGGALTFYVSTDKGNNWVEPDNAGLPALTSTLMEVDRANGRIWLSGTYESGNKWGLYFTDNEGNSWEELSLTSFGAVDYVGGIRQATALKAYDNQLLLGLNNDQDNSVIDVLKSTFADFSDIKLVTEGLAPYPGAVQVAAFAFNGTDFMMALSQEEIYLSSNNASSTVESGQNAIKVFPNPCNDVVNVFGFEANSSYSIYDMSGSLVQEGSLLSSLDLSGIANGMYQLRISSNSGEIKHLEKILVNH